MSDGPKLGVRKRGGTLVKPLRVSAKKRTTSASVLPAQNHHPGAAAVTELVPGIDLMYTVSFHAGRAHLDVAALVRLLKKPQHAGTPKSASLASPAGAAAGGGARIGPYDIFCDQGNRQLWVNDLPLSLEAWNVVLLTDTDGSLAIVGGDWIDGDFGEGSAVGGHPSPGMVGDSCLDLMSRLRERLLQSTAVQRFIQTAGSD